jgi:hypothetical protein
VGGDNDCALQVTLDAQHLDSYTAEIEKVFHDMPFNACKLGVEDFRSISKSLEVVQKAKKLKLPLIVTAGTASKIPVQGDHSILFPSPDTFDADFAVGIGAVQYHGNSVFEAEFSSRLNRLQEISMENPKSRFVGSKFRGVFM